MAGTKPPPTPATRKRLSHNRIELVEIAGHGGMSTVWRGWLHGAHGFKRPVAVKHMSPQLAKQQMYRDMFFEEARVGSLLEDPNIPQVYEYILAGSDHYIVMEYIEGVNLSTLLRFTTERRGQRMPWELVAALGIGLLRALSAAHERVDAEGRPAPIVHRDVSPNNVMISAKGPAKLIDFGLSFAPDRRCGDTDPGVAKGKLPYLSPEIARGHRPSPASDQFAAGSVLWESLIGTRLFDDADRALAFQRLASADITPIREHRDDVPADLAYVIERALALPTEERFPSTREMAKQLGDVLKSSVSSTDLYETLAQMVADARRELGRSHRTQGPTTRPSAADIESGLVLLEEDGKPVALAPGRRVRRLSTAGAHA